MKMKIQFFSAKGHYAAPVTREIQALADIDQILDVIVNDIPHRCEEVDLVDWTRLTIEITRY